MASIDTSSGRLRQLIEEHRAAILDAAGRHRGRRVRVFGSVARGEDRPGSDIDLLVDFDPGSSLFDLMHLQRELEELLRTAVDVVSVGALKPRDAHIVAEAIDL